MNVVIMQPFYLFLRKHFHQVKRADLYIFMDDTQFVKNSHHNRNRIKSQNGLLWLTVPVYHKGKFGQRIMDVEIDNNKNWRQKHWQSIKMCYSKAPYFRRYEDFFENVFQQDWDNLANLNIYLIEHISLLLGINDTEFKRLSDLRINNDNPTQRLIEICERVGADKYIIGTRSKDYMEEWKWKNTNVELEYFEPSYSSYPQLWGEFQEHCAIIDLLFNCGENSGEYIWGKELN